MNTEWNGINDGYKTTNDDLSLSWREMSDLAGDVDVCTMSVYLTEEFPRQMETKRRSDFPSTETKTWMIEVTLVATQTKSMTMT